MRKIVVSLSIAAILAVIAVSLYIFSLNKAPDFNKIGGVRNAPYPFKSMLAVCSDIDGTTLRIFLNVHKYLNTNEDSYLGKGLGLDIADSFWMFAVNDDGAVIDYDGAQNAAVMSYYRPGASELKNDKEIVKFFNSGWIDSIHSYGDFSRVDTSKPVFTKKHAELANKEMLDKSLLPTIWINHGNSANVQNLRKNNAPSNLSYQQGAKPDSEYYHADFTIAAGIKYIWFSNPSDKFSVITPLYPATLDDGQRVWGFDRYTGEDKFIFWHDYYWSSYKFNKQVSEKNLNKLVTDGGVAIVSQHLGTSNGDYIFTAETKAAFERLKQYEENNDILVARTSRLLEYVRTRDYLNFDYEQGVDGEIITIHTINDPVLGTEIVTSPEQLRGICFNVNNPQRAKIVVGGETVGDELLVRSDETAEKGVIGIKWYEKDLNDYTK